MVDKPIIFSAPMIRALLDGRKTQTRRVLKYDKCGAPIMSVVEGDRLWVREAWNEFFEDELNGRQKLIRGKMGIPARPDLIPYIAYRADGEMPDHPEYGKALWRSPIHMPRWASRMTLGVTEVRVQRLQDISEADAVAEGCVVDGDSRAWGVYASDLFEELWNSIHGPDAWDRNPWVCALTFDVHRCNIDQMDAPNGS